MQGRKGEIKDVRDAQGTRGDLGGHGKVVLGIQGEKQGRGLGEAGKE